MAVKIRLTRMGAKKAPFYRIVVIDSRKARDGQYIDQIGYYNPVAVPAEIKIDAEKAQRWLAEGAQPTDVVRSLFKNAGVIAKTVMADRCIIKLAKMGKKKAEFTGIICASVKDGVPTTELIGKINLKTKEVTIDEALLEKWLKAGATVSVAAKQVIAAYQKKAADKAE